MSKRSKALITIAKRPLAWPRRKREYTGDKTILEYSVHRAVKARLDALGAFQIWDTPGVDCVACIDGRFFAVQVLNANRLKKPTSEQRLLAERIRKAGGELLVIDSAEAANNLFVHIA
jgi:hypothetical protein